ncbi:MAG: OsmC family protein, partial [Chloroflexi bacterium]|nr:OsmC family protein [Chloroflexota bacterium]
MKTVVTWKDGMAFEGAGDSGFLQRMDSSASVGGSGSAASPMEFVSLGLAGCTGMDVISILQKKKQPVTGFKVNVYAERSGEHPKVFTEAVIEYLVAGRGVEEAALVRAIELSAGKYCPVYAMLSKAFPIRLAYKLLDDDGTTVIKEGIYTL